MSDAADAFAEQIQASKQETPSAVAQNLVIMSALSVVTILAFNILRPRNRLIYEPKVKYYVGDKRPPRISNGFFSWLPPLIHTKEQELLDKIGLDAVVFLRFLRLLRWLFTAIALLACAILIPVNITYNIKNVKPKKRTKLSFLTLQDVQGTTLFVHVGATYVFTIILLGFVWYHWREMVRLRHQWFCSDEYQNSFYARTLMILHVPKKLQSDAGLKSIFDSLKIPYPTTSVHISRRVGSLPELVEYHNQAVRDLEQVLVRYLKGGKLGKKRPTIHQGGFMGLGGKHVDAIDFYTNRIQNTERAIDEWRAQIDLNKAESYGFASMASVAYAHIVARMLTGKSKKGAIVELSPNPKDIIWKNMVKSDAARSKDRFFGWLWLSAVVFFYTIPLLFISFVANLASVQAFWTPLQNWADASKETFALASSVLPPAISAFFGFFLPKIMRALSRYQGDLTRSRLDRAVVARYFAFLVFSQLFIFTLIGVFYGSITLLITQIGKHASAREIFDKLSDLPRQIQATYIEQSSYWLTWFPLRGFLAVFDLAQLLNVIWISIKTHLFGRTPRDIREWTQPPSFEYAVYVSSMLFMATVGLVYAPIAPLVPLTGAIVFWISSFVYKYQLMFVFTTKVESGGRLWNVIINRLLAGAVLMHLLMLLTIGLIHGWTSYLWTTLVPPIVIVLIFKVWLNAQFISKFRYWVPTESEIAEGKIHSGQADTRGGRLSKRFGHPALHTDLFTPMVHAGMVHLLPQVYHGRLEKDSTGLAEYGGQKVAASVIPSGLKIAAIEQNDLEYDPALYQRDRGETDWDARSIGSTAVLNNYPPGAPTLERNKSSFYAAGPNRTETPPPVPNYDNYLKSGPGMTHGEHIELTHMNSEYGRTTDNLPLLANAAYPDRNQRLSPPQFSRTATGESGWSANESPVDGPPVPMQVYSGGSDFRSAPLHRPYTPSRQGSSYSNAGGGEEVNMAGRGAGSQRPWQ